jgi:hypothetical protein
LIPYHKNCGWKQNKNRELEWNVKDKDGGSKDREAGCPVIDTG